MLRPRGGRRHGSTLARRGRARRSKEDRDDHQPDGKDRLPACAQHDLAPAGLVDRASPNEATTSRHGVPPLRPNARPSSRPRAWLRKHRSLRPSAGGCPSWSAALREERLPRPEAGLLTPGSALPRAFPGPMVPVAFFGLAPRSQWRDRAGLAPASLFSGDGPPLAAASGSSFCRRDSHGYRASEQARDGTAPDHLRTRHPASDTAPLPVPSRGRE